MKVNTRNQRIRRAPTGHRCGQSHHKAKLSDEDVELAREVYESDPKVGYGTLAKKFDNYDPMPTKDYMRDIISRGRRL